MADTLFKGKLPDPRFELRWPFCTVDTKHVALEANVFYVLVSNSISLLSVYPLAPRTRKSPRQDDYEVIISRFKLC
jgi:hypothetical protein